MALQKKVTYTKLCENCGDKGEYMMRDTNYNSTLSDSDIFRIIATTSDFEFEWCDACETKARVKTIAYNYKEIKK
jgi:hypothetical protein